MQLPSGSQVSAIRLELESEALQSFAYHLAWPEILERDEIRTRDIPCKCTLPLSYYRISGALGGIEHDT